MPSFFPVWLLMGLLFSQSSTQNQVNLRSDFDRELVSLADEPPQFPGGMSNFNNYLKKNLRYPKAARKAKLEGRVSVNFVVTEEGHIKDVKLFNSLGLGTDEEAIRLIESMPDWVPGRKDGKAVDMRYNLTINFSLES